MKSARDHYTDKILHNYPTSKEAFAQAEDAIAQAEIYNKSPIHAHTHNMYKVDIDSAVGRQLYAAWVHYTNAIINSDPTTRKSAIAQAEKYNKRTIHKRTQNMYKVDIKSAKKQETQEIMWKVDGGENSQMRMRPIHPRLVSR